MITLDHSKFYHIYNCGINHQNLFESDEHYSFFLRIYDKYVSPIADTYAWVLMKNHFHLLIRIKDLTEIGSYKHSKHNVDAAKFDNVKWETSSNYQNQEKEPYKIPNPILHFSHLFSTYSKYFNNITNRSGSLFERSFKRIQINSEDYLKKLLVYIHCNPVHHSFVNKVSEYQWSSYHTFFSSKPTKLKRREVIDWFDDLDNFEWIHNKKTEYYENLSDFLLE